jgi:hypothetical protein
MPSALYVSRVRWYFNTPEMLARLGKWRHDTLSRVGAYGLGVLRKKLSRPQPQYKRLRTVILPGFYRNSHTGHRWTVYHKCFVPRYGQVIDLTTNRPVVSQAVVREARRIVYERLRGRGEGRPPKMGPTRKLRDRTEFALDPVTETVVIGVVPFADQPEMMGTVSVPQMLDEGGLEVVPHYLTGGGAYALFGRRPYLEPTLHPTRAFLGRLVRSRPVGRYR